MAETQADARRASPLAGLLRALGLDGEHPDQAAGEGAAAQTLANLRTQAEAFSSITVGDVMTPRADVVAIDIAACFAEVVAAFAQCEHSRLPVYRETLDDPVGVAHLRDLFRLLAEPSLREAIEGPVLEAIRRPTLYVPASMLAADLLVGMRTSRTHLAMVIDEFGGLDGVVSLEDVLEAVVGEIDDEHDQAVAPPILERPGGVYEADGRAPLQELEQLVGRPLSDPELEEEIETVAGLVTGLAGRVPQRGEVIAHPQGLEFEVTDADPRRVKRVRIRPAAEPEPPTS